MSTWKIDPTISVSAILACAAIISPILTALINNWHNRRMRKIELEHEKYQETVVYQRKLLENYLQKTAKCLKVDGTEQMDEYAESFGTAISYVPDMIRNEMIAIDKDINDRDIEKAYSRFILLLPELTTKLQKM